MYILCSVASTVRKVYHFARVGNSLFGFCANWIARFLRTKELKCDSLFSKCKYSTVALVTLFVKSDWANAIFIIEQEERWRAFRPFFGNKKGKSMVKRTNLKRITISLRVNHSRHSLLTDDILSPCSLLKSNTSESLPSLFFKERIRANKQRAKVRKSEFTTLHIAAPSVENVY